METLPVINKTYDLYKQIIEANTKLDKKWRYSLGLSLENTVLECMDNLIKAKNAPKASKAVFLISASSLIEISSFKLRLLLELNLVNSTKIFQSQATVREIGRMLGGWLKSLS